MDHHLISGSLDNWIKPLSASNSCCPELLRRCLFPTDKWIVGLSSVRSQSDPFFRALVYHSTVEFKIFAPTTSSLRPPISDRSGNGQKKRETSSCRCTALFELQIYRWYSGIRIIRSGRGRRINFHKSFKFPSNLLCGPYANCKSVCPELEPRFSVNWALTNRVPLYCTSTCKKKLHATRLITN